MVRPPLQLEEFIVIGAISLSRLGKVKSTGDIDFGLILGTKPLSAIAGSVKPPAAAQIIIDQFALFREENRHQFLHDINCFDA